MTTTTNKSTEEQAVSEDAFRQVIDESALRKNYYFRPLLVRALMSVPSLIERLEAADYIVENAGRLPSFMWENETAKQALKRAEYWEKDAKQEAVLADWNAAMASEGLL